MLDSVKLIANEMLVVDCGSTDATVEIARARGARVIVHPWQGYARQKQFALEHCRNDWCLCLDADEALSKEAVEGIPALLDNAEVAAWRFKRKDTFVGHVAPEVLHQQGGTRLMRKSRSRFDTSRTVHEKLIVEGEVRLCDLTFLHFGYDNLELLSDKNNRYSSLKAREKAARQRRPSYLRLIFSGPLKFLQYYLVQRNFLWGWKGFARSVATAYYGFSVEAKRFEIAARNSRPQSRISSEGAEDD